MKVSRTKIHYQNNLMLGMRPLALLATIATAISFLFLFSLCYNNISTTTLYSRNLLQETSYTQQQQQQTQKQRILYIVTSVAEYDNGRRKTIQGRDRFVETLIPVVSESVSSMLEQHNFEVDVYLIAHYTLPPERKALLQQALPDQVGLEIWDDATPLSYVRPKEGDTTHITDITRALARQHRYVIRDKLTYYNFFVCFEDDMLIHGSHVQQYLHVSQQIELLKESAPDHRMATTFRTQQQALDSFHGPMSRVQLQRVIPGFIRVEVANNTDGFQTRTRPGKIPVLDESITVDPRPCCQRPNEQLPSSRDLFLWETHLRALGIRKMPPKSSSLDWVLLQRGGNPYGLEPEVLIGDYWAGRQGDFNTTGIASEDLRPEPMESIYANNQGGWMATRSQLWQWHTRTCLGGFLPPFYEPTYPKDGMNHVVEYWSGGGNLVGRLACHLQRIIPLDPTQFSKHLLYHTSNNKQKQLKFVRGLFSQVDVLLGQLHTVRKRAERTLRKEMNGE